MYASHGSTQNRLHFLFLPENSALSMRKVSQEQEIAKTDESPEPLETNSTVISRNGNVEIQTCITKEIPCLHARKNDDLQQEGGEHQEDIDFDEARIKYTFTEHQNKQDDLDGQQCQRIER